MKDKSIWANHVINFLAVILGVYLAFYINERSALNKEKKEKQTFLHSLTIDLSEDIRTFEEYQIPQNIQQQQHIGELLERLRQSDPGDIGEALSAVFQVENFTPTTSTYNSIKASGKLQLIDDLNLQKELSNYYEGLVLESAKKGDFQADYFTGELLAWLTQNVDLLDMSLLKTDELTVLRNKIIIYGSLIDQKVNDYQSIVEDSKQLKSSIEKNLASGK